MPTATAFAWVFPWNELVGGFNAFIGMLNTPIALAGSLILVFSIARFVIGAFRSTGG